MAVPPVLLMTEGVMDWAVATCDAQKISRKVRKGKNGEEKGRQRVFIMNWFQVLIFS